MAEDDIDSLETLVGQIDEEGEEEDMGVDVIDDSLIEEYISVVDELMPPARSVGQIVTVVMGPGG